MEDLFSVMDDRMCVSLRGIVHQLDASTMLLEGLAPIRPFLDSSRSIFPYALNSSLIVHRSTTDTTQIDQLDNLFSYSSFFFLLNVNFTESERVERGLAQPLSQHCYLFLTLFYLSFVYLYLSKVKIAFPRIVNIKLSILDADFDERSENWIIRSDVRYPSVREMTKTIEDNPPSCLFFEVPL